MHDRGALVVTEAVGLRLDILDDLVQLGVVPLSDLGGVPAQDLGRHRDGLLHLLIGAEFAGDHRDADFLGLVAQLVVGVEDDLRGGVDGGELLEIEAVPEGGRRAGHVGADLVHPGELLGVAVRGLQPLGAGEHDDHLVVGVPAIGVGSRRGWYLDLRAGHVGDGLRARAR